MCLHQWPCPLSGLPFIACLIACARVFPVQVGVLLSVGLALLTHPWLWTWLVPRYYFVVVGIAVVYACNRVGRQSPGGRAGTR